MSELTKGAVMDFYSRDSLNDYRPVVQINAIKRCAYAQGPTIRDKHKFLVSDGTHYTTALSIGGDINKMVEDGRVTKNTVVQIDRSNKTMACGKPVFLILDLTFVAHKDDKIGNPQKIDDDMIRQATANRKPAPQAKMNQNVESFLSSLEVENDRSKIIKLCLEAYDLFDLGNHEIMTELADELSKNSSLLTKMVDVIDVEDLYIFIYEAVRRVSRLELSIVFHTFLNDKSSNFKSRIQSLPEEDFLTLLQIIIDTLIEAGKKDEITCQDTWKDIADIVKFGFDYVKKSDDELTVRDFAADVFDAMKNPSFCREILNNGLLCSLSVLLNLWGQKDNTIMKNNYKVPGREGYGSDHTGSKSIPEMWLTSYNCISLNMILDSEKDKKAVLLALKNFIPCFCVWLNELKGANPCSFNIEPYLMSIRHLFQLLSLYMGVSGLELIADYKLVDIINSMINITIIKSVKAYETWRKYKTTLSEDGPCALCVQLNDNMILDLLSSPHLIDLPNPQTIIPSLISLIKDYENHGSIIDDHPCSPVTKQLLSVFHKFLEKDPSMLCMELCKDNGYNLSFIVNAVMTNKSDEDDQKNEELVEMLCDFLYMMLCATKSRELSRCVLSYVNHCLAFIVKNHLVNNFKTESSSTDPCIKYGLPIVVLKMARDMVLYSSFETAKLFTLHGSLFHKLWAVLNVATNKKVVSYILKILVKILEMYQFRVITFDSLKKRLPLLWKKRNISSQTDSYIGELFGQLFLEIDPSNSRNEIKYIEHYLTLFLKMDNFKKTTELPGSVWLYWVLNRNVKICETIQILRTKSEDTYIDIKFGDIKAAKVYKYLCDIILEIIDRDPPCDSKHLMDLTKCMIKIAESTSAREELYVLEDLVPASMELSGKIEDKIVIESIRKFLSIIA